MSILQTLVGKCVVGVDYVSYEGNEANALVISFGSKAKDNNDIFSTIYVCCYARIRNASEMLLTMSDIFYSENLQKLPYDQYIRAEFYNFEDTLLRKNCDRVRRYFDNPSCLVSAVTTNDIGDIFITVGDMQIEIMPDCIQHGLEYYRIDILGGKRQFALRNFRGRNVFEVVA